ncbi:HMG box domain containing 4 [Nesidiocoris tenuis]|uniref:HMG box domain containing 4 n=1 Tax=Nesidiocoris tenuis TaxID=355587 RepID=A0ABN7AMD0_9HEMI|nr:HMG box domain containing 4 [Nesidiocoris tenuis]
MDKKFVKKKEEFPPKLVKQETDLEVTGVSRSGRVRKKSSKLMDFENLDEIDIRASASKKRDRNESSLTPGEPDSIRPPKKEKPTVKEEVFSDEIFNSLLQDLGDSPAPYAPPVKQETMSDESAHDITFPPQREESDVESMVSEPEDVEEQEVSRVEAEGFQSIAGDSSISDPSQPRSLYPAEKSSSKKKLVIKDGKIVGRTKSPKKDKGQSRLTAYMLWAKEIRQELQRTSPNLDFSQTSKKLGELWATVPQHEKHIWKKRAKRQAELDANPNLLNPDGSPVSPVIAATPPKTKTTGNRNSGGATPKHQEAKKPKTPTKKFSNKGQQQFHHDINSTPTHSLNLSSPLESKGTSKSHNMDLVASKSVMTSPLDVAAHIRLLSESLSIIGERLNEHEGQIAVSGSLSVLLDSLLCVTVPMMCLTQQVPELNVVPQEQLSQMMDNIAYIMPGL